MSLCETLWASDVRIAWNPFQYAGMVGQRQDWSRFLAPLTDHDLPIEEAAAFEGQSILITGAGGFIGSAVARALGGTPGTSITLLDSSEYNLFEINRNLRERYPNLNFRAVLGSVDDQVLLNEVFTSSKPDIIFHAAAFKHVGLLESNPFIAIQNNVLGTYQLVQTARQQECQRLLLISTDKAVRPHSVMGASKRIAELLTVSATGLMKRFNAVRLGNVIGSSGSVVPLFREQIRKHQPVTVTDLRASRYFLSLCNTVKAVLAAGSTHHAGKILVPELGDPVPIVDLARYLIDASSNGTGRPSELQFTGLMPGEKVSEDLMLADEIELAPDDSGLRVLTTKVLSNSQVESAVQSLTAAVTMRDANALLKSVHSLVPEYVPSEPMRRHAELLKR